MRSTLALPATQSTRPLSNQIGRMRVPAPTVLVRGLQPQLIVSRTSDPSEREAERVADAVAQGDGVERRSARIAATPGTGLQVSEESANLVNRTVRSNGEALDSGTRLFMERRFARDFSSVRIHADSQANHSARSVGANAYTIGSHVVFGANRFAPATQSGKRLIAHELAHVVQQSQSAAPFVSREPTDDPDANVSLGYVDNKYVGAAAEQIVGPGHWTILREFMRGLWGGLQALPPEQRARIDQKMQDFGLTNAVKYVGGYALGIVEGLWASIKGLAEAVVTLVGLPYHIGKFLGEHMPALAAKYGPRIAAVLMDRQSVSGRIESALGKLLANPAMAVRQLSALFDALGAIALTQVRKLGHGVAGEAMALLEQPWFDYGRSIGKIVGQVLFEVILALASDAIANIVKEALSVAARLGARVVTGAMQLIKSAGRFVGEAVEWVGRLGRSAAGEVGEMFEGLRALLKRVKTLLAELGEEAALTDTGGVRMPIPGSQVTVVESRAAGTLTPPKIHPSKAGGIEAAPKPTRPGSAAFDEPLTAEELVLSPDELRQEQVREDLADMQHKFSAATKDEAATGWGRAEVRTPGGSVPKQLERGQFAHEWAELLIPESKLPKGLAKEVRAELPGGSVRLDRVDFKNGVYYEIKPDSRLSRIAGQDQIRIYAEYMNRNFPLPDGRKWAGMVVTYDKSAAIGLFGL